MRILLHSPKDLFAGALAFAAVGAIIANAMFMQTGHHPSPMFGSSVVVNFPPASANLLPRPRPVEADTQAAEAKPAAGNVAEPKAAGSGSADPLANLVRSTAIAPVTSAHVQRPPAPIPVSTHPAARRIAAVQRTLTEYGYGQLKANGTIGPDTQAAIQKFEFDRRMPVTGQVSDRLVRELTAMTGRPVD